MLEDYTSLIVPITVAFGVFGVLIAIAIGRSTSRRNQLEEWQDYAGERGYEYTPSDNTLTQYLRGFPQPIQGEIKHILRGRLRGCDLYVYEIRDKGEGGNRLETHALFVSPDLHLPSFSLVEMAFYGLFKGIINKLMGSGTVVEFADGEDFQQQFTLLALQSNPNQVKEFFSPRLRNELFTVAQTYKATDIPSNCTLQIMGHGRLLDFHYNGYTINSGSRDSFMEQAEALLRLFMSEQQDNEVGYG